MKKNYLKIAAACAVLFFTGCSKYFEVDTNDILKDEDYVGNANELYSGYMGIAAKVQKVADQAVFWQTCVQICWNLLKMRLRISGISITIVKNKVMNLQIRKDSMILLSMQTITSQRS